MLILSIFINKMNSDSISPAARDIKSTVTEFGCHRHGREGHLSQSMAHSVSDLIMNLLSGNLLINRWGFAPNSEVYRICFSGEWYP